MVYLNGSGNNFSLNKTAVMKISYEKNNPIFWSVLAFAVGLLFVFVGWAFWESQIKWKADAAGTILTISILTAVAGAIGMFYFGSKKKDV